MGMKLATPPHTPKSEQFSDSHVPVDLLGLPVATQQTAQDSHATHPAQLLWHTGVGSTLPLTWHRAEGHLGKFTFTHTPLLSRMKF